METSEVSVSISDSVNWDIAENLRAEDDNQALVLLARKCGTLILQPNIYRLTNFQASRSHYDNTYSTYEFS
jgi:hypothetical protein